MNRDVTKKELNGLLCFHPDSKRSVKNRRKKGSAEPTGDNGISDSTLCHSESLCTESPPSSHDTFSDEDPVILESIRERIAEKNRLTLRISGFPAKTTIPSVTELIPDARSIRMHWNSATHQNTGVAYIEFQSDDMLETYKHKLDGMSFNDKQLTTRTGQFLPEDLGRYELNKLVLHGLHYKTHVAEVAKRFASASDIKLVKGQTRDRRKAIQAILTFQKPQDALRAFDCRRFCVIRRHRIAVTWLLKGLSGEQRRQKKCLLVRGLKKVVTEDDLRTVFPQACTISIRQASGDALLHYDLEEDCILDYKNARGIRLYKRKLQVAYTHVKTKSTSSSNTEEPSSNPPKVPKKKRRLSTDALSGDSDKRLRKGH